MLGTLAWQGSRVSRGIFIKASYETWVVGKNTGLLGLPEANEGKPPYFPLVEFEHPHLPLSLGEDL